MKKTNVVAICAWVVGTLFASNAIAAEKYSMTLAASTVEAKDAAKHHLTDNQLAANVRDKFVKEKLFGKDKFADMGIHVTADKGVVTLTGRVDSKKDEAKAEKLAKSVDEVKSVVSKIVVKEDKKDVKK